MRVRIKEIQPRQHHTSNVMNVVVEYKIPEIGRRNNIVEVTVFIDKEVRDLDAIHDLALSQSYSLLKRIIDDHPQPLQ